MAFISISITKNHPLILGKGGFGRQLADWLSAEGWGEAEFLDDSAPGCVGGLRDYADPKLLKPGRPAFVALGDNALRVELLQKRTAPTVLTPHEGEFLRLGGDLSRGREAAAAAFSRNYGVYLVLKGHHTLVAAPDGCMAVNGTGNSGMAKGGSGDVLAGMLLSLLGQGCEAYDACCAAVWLHGRAGDLAAADKGERGMTPTDLLEQIPYAMKNL